MGCALVGRSAPRPRSRVVPVAVPRRSAARRSGRARGRRGRPARRWAPRRRRPPKASWWAASTIGPRPWPQTDQSGLLDQLAQRCRIHRFTGLAAACGCGPGPVALVLRPFCVAVQQEELHHTYGAASPYDDCRAGGIVGGDVQPVPGAVERLVAHGRDRNRRITAVAETSTSGRHADKPGLCSTVRGSTSLWWASIACTTSSDSPYLRARSAPTPAWVPSASCVSALPTSWRSRRHAESAVELSSSAIRPARADSMRCLRSF